jgi:hypothetical protein
MIEHILSVVCDKASIDKDTNSVSIFNIIEQVTLVTAKEPSDANQVSGSIDFELLSMWTRGMTDVPEKGQARVSFIDPNGKKGKEIEVTIDLMDHFFYRTRIMANQVALSGPGKYRFEIEVKEDKAPQWRNVTSIPLLVLSQVASESV